MTHLKYLACFSFMFLFGMALSERGLWSFVLPIFVFGVVPTLELLMPASTVNFSQEEEDEALADPIYDGILYTIVPAQYLFLIAYLYIVATQPLAWWELAGLTFSMGTFCGGFGINVAHELGHRKKQFEQVLAKALLLTSLYMHFFIEHNRGHHSNVATDDDPASSRYRENLYSFWLRSVWHSYFSAWSIENARLRKKGQAVWSWSNEMLRFQVVQVAFVAGIFVLFGSKAGLAFIAAAVIGFLHLETVNYIEHYGLRRQKRDNGRYEFVRPVHSWNSNHSLGRIFLFELTRHSDHHAHANRPYQVLRHYDESPQLPTGYPGMMVLSLVPSLYFRVMDRALERHGMLPEQLEKAAVEQQGLAGQAV